MSTRRFALFGLLTLAVLALRVFGTVQPAAATDVAPNSISIELAHATHVTPVLFAGNPSCTGLGYDFGFKPQPEPPPSDTYPFPGDLVNDVTITTDGTFFDWTSTLGIDAVIVKGSSNANVYTYDPPAEEFSDTGLHSPINPNNGQPFAISHIEFCYDYELDVSKDAHTTFTRTYDWDITKTPDEDYIGFAGDTFPHEYTITVNRTGFTDSDWAVNGDITIENNTPFDANIENVSDVVSAGISASVNCGVAFPYTLVAGDTLTCSYSTSLPDGTNRTNTATVTTSDAVDGGEATADVIFGDPTTEVNATVNVTDDYGTPGDPSDDLSFGPLANGESVKYSRDFICSSEPNDYTGGTYSDPPLLNTSTIDETGDDDTATVNLTCYAPVVEKNANIFLKRTWIWTIDKHPDGEYWMFIGENTDHDYTIDVDKVGSTDSDWMVEGTITVYNNHPTEAMTVSLSDSISDFAGPVTLDCGGSLDVPANSSATCDYSADLPNADTRTNTATATLNAIGFDGTTEIDFTNADVTEVAAEINVTDDYGTADTGDDLTFGPFEDDASKGYTRNFDCPTDTSLYVDGVYEYTVNNIATIDETGDNDSAQVIVHCYAPVVKKDANTSLTRSWDWTIDKTADQTELLLSSGQAPFLVNYKVTVDATSTDSDWAVEGTITVYNNHPTEAMTVSLADSISGFAGPVTLDCGGSLDVPANSSATCDYSADLPNADTRTNTATATLNAIDFEATAEINFTNADVTEVDDCIEVSDNNLNPDFLGTICVADGLPVEFTYSVSFGQHPEADVYLECGETTHLNIASFVVVDDENDTGESGWDTWTVTATVECDVGCTLTPGYWKTHSEYGPAPYDDTWAMLANGADTPFFSSGQTYYEVLWTPPQGGNAYYILAHAYIAAQLNFMNGADPSAVEDANGPAMVLLGLYTPEQVAEFKGKTGKDLRDQFISLAGILDDYNNGLTGPGHCSE